MIPEIQSIDQGLEAIIPRYRSDTPKTATERVLTRHPSGGKERADRVLRRRRGPWILRPMADREIVEEWAEVLSERLGREAAQIRANGLSAGDFSGDEEVEIEFIDGSRACFKYAFFVVDAARKHVAVFTEHCGYWVIPSSGLQVTRVRRDLFVGEHRQ